MVRQPKKIIAIKTRAMGDTVLMTAPLIELKKAFPQTQIDIVVTPAWKGLFENFSPVNKIHVYERKADKASRAKAIARLALQIAKENYQWALNFHASPSSALLTLASRAPVRSVHFHGHNTKNKYSTVVIPGKGEVKPNIERDMDVLRSVGLSIPNGKMPNLLLSQVEIESAKRFLIEKNIQSPVLALGIGASRPTKSWELEKFSELIQKWLAQFPNGNILILASQTEATLAQTILQQNLSHQNKITPLIGLPLRQLAAILSHCNVYAGNDTGPKHMAVATQTPTVTVFGPEDPFEWHPYCSEQHAYSFIKDLDCRKDALPGLPPWCGIDVCTQFKHRCMSQIQSDEVFSKMLQVMK